MIFCYRIKIRAESQPLSTLASSSWLSALTGHIGWWSFAGHSRSSWILEGLCLPGQWCKHWLGPAAFIRSSGLGLRAPPLLPGQWPLQEPWFPSLLSGEATPLPWVTMSFELSAFVVLWALASWLLLLPLTLDFLPGCWHWEGPQAVGRPSWPYLVFDLAAFPGGLLLGQTWFGRKCPHLSWLPGSPFNLTGWKGPSWPNLFSWGSSPQLHWVSWESSEWASSWAAFSLCAQEVIWSCQWPPWSWSWWTWGRGQGVCHAGPWHTPSSR